MTIYGRLTGTVMALALIAGGSAFAASAAGEIKDSLQRAAEELSCYIVKEYNGSIALFKEGEAEPLAVYSTPMSEINSADAALLRSGIRLRGMSEVSRLLEDLDVE